MKTDNIEVLSLAEWKVRFKPIINPFEPNIRFFRAGGEQEEFVANQDPKYVWSDAWDFYEEQNLLINEYVPSDIHEVGSDRPNEEVFFVCEVANEGNLVVLFESLTDLHGV